ncbi:MULTISPECIES: SulP family inorganic anion transporter [unclassified Rhodococcus (in: high G+C Gram-positive bacteria)]|uniref:SulP family inorganic anion transporter n=1 Tax=unclassified Rhodococcus (in: high G+C Gram-positive bacteria) TaxID=192944 RepID=UPI00339462C0
MRSSQGANLVVTALVVVTLDFLAPVLDYLPVPTLAAIVIVAGLGLFDVVVAMGLSVLLMVLGADAMDRHGRSNEESMRKNRRD